MKIRIFVILAMVLSLLSACSLPKITLFSEKGEPLKEYTLEGSGKDKILVMSVDGVISDQPQQMVLRSRPSLVQQTAAYLKHAQKDRDIKALLVKVNSPGGSVTASDIIYHEISAYKERTGVKVVVAMMNIAASGGYYISLPADRIVAHPTTLTGSIGVIFMRPGVSGLMEKVGLSMQVHTSGANKDMGSPYRLPTLEEEALFQGLTDELAGRFLDLVVKHRHLQPEQRAQIATARVYLADQARQLGLVDQIGYLDDAIAQAKQIAGLGKEARVVAYRRYKPQEETLYDPAIQTTGADLAALVPGLAPLSAMSEAGFYYLWPAGAQ